MDNPVSTLSLDQRPCVVHYLEHKNQFIIGTYELYQNIEEARPVFDSQLSDRELTEILEWINFRAGQLVLVTGNEDVSTSKIEYQYDCSEGGGVFDAKVVYDRQNSVYILYAGHSNGMVGIYEISCDCDTQIWLRQSLNVEGSSMLTSIDIYPEIEQGQDQENKTLSSEEEPKNQLGTNEFPNSSRIVVGDSDGYVTILDKHTPIRKLVSEFHSIWQVKSLRLAPGRDLVIVTSDNSSWSIHSIDESNRELITLYSNTYRDFEYGVTSIFVLDIIHLNNHDFIELLLGSYDETVKTYHLKLDHDQTIKPKVSFKESKTIPGGGIWRIKAWKKNGKGKLLIAAMYSGCYLLTLNCSSKLSLAEFQKQMELETTFNTLTGLIDIESLNMTNKSLHYDIDISSSNGICCIADFNNKCCLMKSLVH